MSVQGLETAKKVGDRGMKQIDETKNIGGGSTVEELYTAHMTL